jgi:hypothetical protein
MKITSYEISKQLAEAGFKAEAHHIEWMECGKSLYNSSILPRAA